MSASDHDLLEQFTREQSQDAFTALVDRHLSLVYSAAVRQVRSPQLAEEVCQSVFLHLARHAAKLAPDTILTAWLYQVTRHSAVDVIRREARRVAREQIAIQMSDMNETAPDWTHIEPLLDEAMQSLEDADRTAILLRYFENKSLREVGVALGASEDAAQKRVARAVERLREFFGNRKVTVGASGLAALLSAHAVQAAPAGLAGAVVTGAVLSSTTLGASTAVAVTKTVVMTTLQKAIITAGAVGAVAIGIYQSHLVSSLRSQVRTLESQKAEQAMLNKQLEALRLERDRATNALAAYVAENAALKKNPIEVLKLRGEVGRLRQDNVQMGSKSPLSKVTASPEARRLLRDTQKRGMGVIYKDFAQRLKLAPDQSDKFHDLLADHIMDNVDNAVTVLRDKPTPQQMNAVFAAQEAALQQKVEALLGPEALAQYQDYTKNLLSSLSTDEFKEKLTGTDAEKEAKAKQLRLAIQTATQVGLANAGLPADYQAVPILNFANIASEPAAEQNLKLLDDIYQRAAASSGAFLTPGELAKFQEFRAAAVKDSRAALTMNRAMMAPLSN